jgi:SHS2 domain-containing protein
VEHVGEVEVSLRAPDLPALFAEAALALAELMAAKVEEGPQAGERIEVRGRDPEALLVAFVDELIYRSEMSARLWTRVEIERLTATELAATIAGPPVSEVAVPVKAATLHGLSIRGTNEGYEASMILDV